MTTAPCYIPLGRFIRQHNFEGALLLESPRYLPDSLADLETLFVAVEGLPVPFFPEEIRFTGDTTAIVKLEEIGSEKCSMLIGCDVMCIAGDLPEDDGPDQAFDWTGYRVLDATHTAVGTISDAEDFNGNMVLHLDTPRGEQLIPFHEDLLIAVDEDARTLTLTIPDGLLEN